MEYTDQEIEMLARFDHDSSAARRPCWDELEPESRRRIVELVFDLFADDSACSVLRAAARLMREARHEGRLAAEEEHRAALSALHSERDAQEDRAVEDAREQGAAEMRERAALVALQPDICPVDGPVAAERIRALPLTVPQ